LLLWRLTLVFCDGDNLVVLFTEKKYCCACGGLLLWRLVLVCCGGAGLVVVSVQKKCCCGGVCLLLWHLVFVYCGGAKKSFRSSFLYRNSLEVKSTKFLFRVQTSG